MEWGIVKSGIKIRSRGAGGRSTTRHCSGNDAFAAHLNFNYATFLYQDGMVCGTVHVAPQCDFAHHHISRKGDLTTNSSSIKIEL